ncbi:collagen alpha-3(VI) chain-like [Sciurus carolinensis]|uniref:collagen alpha-3(VI) chain-like n=1 Tax=Sciurus carolinensis TaxID=30640 RepID=UPI001FB52B68|nr:collagen alpha-3(VI) chain-like [Sciurus carolinensis]
METGGTTGAELRGLGGESGDAGTKVPGTGRLKAGEERRGRGPGRGPRGNRGGSSPIRRQPKAESVSGCERAWSGERGRRAVRRGAPPGGQRGNCGGPARAGRGGAPSGPARTPRAAASPCDHSGRLRARPEPRSRGSGAAAVAARGRVRETPQTCGYRRRPSGRRPAGERRWAGTTDVWQAEARARRCLELRELNSNSLHLMVPRNYLMNTNFLGGAVISCYPRRAARRGEGTSLSTQEEESPYWTGLHFSR